MSTVAFAGPTGLASARPSDAAGPLTIEERVARVRQAFVEQGVARPPSGAACMPMTTAQWPNWPNWLNGWPNWGNFWRNF
jgi:hypothetical protein